MAFSKKLTDILTDAADVARADGADMFTFLMKKKSEHMVEATSIGNSDDPVTMFCVVSTLLDAIAMATGMTKKQILKTINKEIKTTVKAQKRGKCGRDLADFD